MDSNNKITNKDINETDYWQTQAILVMNNINLGEKSNNIFPIKYTIKSKNNNNKIDNLELMEDISI